MAWVAQNGLLPCDLVVRKYAPDGTVMWTVTWDAETFRQRSFILAQLAGHGEHASVGQAPIDPGSPRIREN